MRLNLMRRVASTEPRSGSFRAIWPWIVVPAIIVVELVRPWMVVERNRGRLGNDLVVASELVEVAATGKGTLSKANRRVLERTCADLQTIQGGTQRDRALRALAVLQREFPHVGDPKRTVALLRRDPADALNRRLNAFYHLLYSGGVPRQAELDALWEHIPGRGLRETTRFHLLEAAGNTDAARDARKRFATELRWVGRRTGTAMGFEGAAVSIGVLVILGYVFLRAHPRTPRRLQPMLTRLWEFDRKHTPPWMAALERRMLGFRSPAPSRPEWLTADAGNGLLIAFGFYWVSRYAAGIALTGLVDLNAWLKSSAAWDLLSASVDLLLVLVTVLLVAAYGRRSGFSLAKVGLNARRLVPFIALAVMAVLADHAQFKATTQIDRLLSKLLPHQGHDYWFILYGATPRDLTVDIFTGAVVAPFVEEFLMRGLLLGAVWSRWGFWPAAVASSLVFGMLHNNPFGTLVSHTSFGIIACILVRETRSLVPGMLMHLLNNGFVSMAEYFT